jgi:hypothetical protein
MPFKAPMLLLETEAYWIAAKESCKLSSIKRLKLKNLSQEKQKVRRTIISIKRI